MVGQYLPWYAPPAPGIWAGSKPPWAPPGSMWKAVRSPWLIGQLLMICKQQALMKTFAGRMELIYHWFARFRSFWRWTSWIVLKVFPDIPSHLRPLLVHLHLCHLCLTQAYAWGVLQAMQFIGLLGRDCLIMTLLPILSAIPLQVPPGKCSTSVEMALEIFPVCWSAWVVQIMLHRWVPASVAFPTWTLRAKGIRTKTREIWRDLGRSGETDPKPRWTLHDIAVLLSNTVSGWVNRWSQCIMDFAKKKSAGSWVQEPADWPWPACYLLIWLSMCPLQGLTLSYWRI